MKTYLLLIISILFTGTLIGQVSFSDDFEDYNVGDLIAESSPDWELWPAAAATDAAVTDEQAAGGEKSLRMPGGEDIDIILPFTETFREGTFNISFDVFIPSGRTSYFNLQGNSDVGGPTGLWVLQCTFTEDGIFNVDNGGGNFLFSNAYDQNEWINITVDANLTENLWRMFVNGECLGSFINPVERNSLYALNLYPIDGNSLTFVDNVKFTHTDDAQAVDIALDASYAGGIDVDAQIGRSQGVFYGIADTDQTLQVNVSNEGTMDITSGTITITAGAQTITQEINEMIPSGETASIAIDDKVTFEDGDLFGEVRLSNINGMAEDDNTCNDIAPMLFAGFTPAPGKKVYVEEATGTWCTWCPRGDVFMNYLAKKYPDHFVGVAVHNSDPMADTAWDGGGTQTGLDALIGGYPSAVMGRSEEIDPANLEGPFVDEVTIEPLLTMNHGALFDEGTRQLDVNVATDFSLVALTNGTRLMVGLTEDGVTGEGDGSSLNPQDYDQTNAYSGGVNGAMGGFEDLPNPVPATDMVYNHVGRMLMTSFAGLENAFADTEGLSENHTFSATIPAEWNVDNMHIVSVFVRADGTIENAHSTTIAEAIANGYTNTIDVYLDSNIELFPNPTRDQANVTFEFDKPTEMIMELTDAMGRSLTTENYGTISGKKSVSVDLTGMNAGVYYMSFRSGNQSTVKRLIIAE